jgi:hypothetical protein
MTNSPALFTGPLASLYFKPIPEGQIFTGPPPWIFGNQREYRLSNAQAEQLLTRVSRAYIVGIIGVSAIMIAGISAAVGIVHMTAGDPDQFFASHPIAYVGALLAFTFLMIGLYVAYIYRAAATVLTGLSWTVAPPEPYSLRANVKKTIAIETLFPTWVLTIFVALFLVGIPLFGVPAIKALASGRLTFDLFQAVFFLVMAVFTGAVLLAKLKGQRPAK